SDPAQITTVSFCDAVIRVELNKFGKFSLALNDDLVNLLGPLFGGSPFLRVGTRLHRNENMTGSNFWIVFVIGFHLSIRHADLLYLRGELFLKQSLVNFLIDAFLYNRIFTQVCFFSFLYANFKSNEVF